MLSICVHTYLHVRVKIYLGTIQVLHQQNWVGGVRKWQFLLIYSTTYADVGEWVGLKKPKTC